MDYAKLLDYCKTERETEIIQACINGGSGNKAAAIIGCDPRNVHRTVNKIKANAAWHGHCPEYQINRPVPDDILRLSGLSDMRTNEDGKPVWYKFTADQMQVQAAMKATVAAMSDDLPKIKIAAPKIKHPEKDIIPWINIGDAHIGALMHEAEVGHNFDLKIAERELCCAIKCLVDRAPMSERCVINDLGDATHYENFRGETEGHGHALDYDGRFPKMIRVYRRIMLYIIEYAASKFKYVDVIINQGNHSRTNDIWMAELLRDRYEKEPRITVLDNTCIFIPYRMGNTLIVTHHQDKCKPNKFLHVMQVDFAKDWGEATYRYGYNGHVHHQNAKNEGGGAIIESMNNLAPMDKYAHDGGWRSRSFLTMTLMSKTYGEKGRELITAEEVKDILNNVPAGTEAKKRRAVYTV